MTERERFDKWYDAGPYGNCYAYIQERMFAAWQASAREQMAEILDLLWPEAEHSAYAAELHGWQYEGPIDGHEGKDDVVVVRCCINCGRREMAYTRKFVLAKGDYALDDHYQGMIGAK